MSNRFRLAIATCQQQPFLIESERYLIDSLSECGITAQPVIWDDTQVKWSGFDGILIRTIWDYHKQHNRFLEWLDVLEQSGLIVGNPTELLAWNSHKFYLNELQKHGITIPATQLLPKGTDLNTIELVWDDFIIKPAVSATAFQTFKLTPQLLAERRSEIGLILNSKDTLMQQFIPSIATSGEWSLLFFNHIYSHAVLKQADVGEYRVQAEYGGSYKKDTPNKLIIDFAEMVLSKIKTKSLYARVDMVIHDDVPLLMELELIEPELFLLTDEIRSSFCNCIADYFLSK
ncbi:MAG: hypothetical protein AAGC88_12395 [Bacteroidota bacterium]